MMAARLPWAQEVRGSNPRPPTNIFGDNDLQNGNFGTGALWCNLGTMRKMRAEKIACELRVSNWNHGEGERAACVPSRRPRVRAHLPREQECQGAGDCC